MVIVEIRCNGVIMIDLSHWAKLPRLFCNSEADTSVLELRTHVKKLERRMRNCRFELRAHDEDSLATLEAHVDLMIETLELQRTLLFERSVLFCIDKVVQEKQRLESATHDDIRKGVGICKELLRQTSDGFLLGLSREEVQLVGKLKKSCACYIMCVIRLCN